MTERDSKREAELLPAVEISPRGSPRASVIWLHGLGADGHDFEPIVPELGLSEDSGVRFVFPHAPRRPVTINNGLVMRAWYDIRSIDVERGVEEEHLETSRLQIETWIAHERRLGIPSEKIVVAGFSQGGAIALLTGLQHREPLGGIFGLSCYHPLVETVEERASEANRRTPIFMGHGTEDPLVPVSLAEETARKLEALGYDIEWHIYPMPHSVSPQEIADVGRWLKAPLA